MTGIEVYNIASKNIDNTVIVYCFGEILKGRFNNDESELRFSTLSNLWDFTEYDGWGDIKIRSHWIEKIEYDIS